MSPFSINKWKGMLSPTSLNTEQISVEVIGSTSKDKSTPMDDTKSDDSGGSDDKKPTPTDNKSSGGGDESSGVTPPSQDGDGMNEDGEDSSDIDENQDPTDDSNDSEGLSDNNDSGGLGDGGNSPEVKDPALTPHTTIDRRKTIAKQLETLYGSIKDTIERLSEADTSVTKPDTLTQLSELLNQVDDTITVVTKDKVENLMYRLELFNTVYNKVVLALQSTQK